MVGGRGVDRDDSSLFFLRLRERGVNRVRLGTRQEYKRGEQGLWVKGQAESVVWRDRSRVDVTGSTGEGEEVQQRASLLSSMTDFSFSCRRGGSRNNMSKLGGSWIGEGVVGGEKAGDRVLEGVQGGEGVGLGGKEVFRDCRHLSR